MYGTWFIVTLGALGAVVLVLALMLTASPLFAIIAFIVIAAALAFGASMRRGGEYVDRDEAAGTPHPDPADLTVSDPDRRGAPVGGSRVSEPTSPPPSPGAPSR